MTNASCSVKRYTVFDVETPNRYQRSICSIGLVHIEEGSDPVYKYFLVNPEDHFDEENIRIHSINARDVEHEATFPEIWAEISEWFTNGLIIAHNASFDIPVIHKMLNQYHMPIPDFYYICTMQKAKKHFAPTQFGGYSLNALCEGYHITLENHHNALDDAKACAELFQRLKFDFGCAESEISVYHPTIQQSREKLDAQSEQSLNTLHGILLGIGYDRQFLPMEHERLSNWNKEQCQSSNHDVKVCCKAVLAALEDGILARSEYEGLLALSDITASCSAQFCKTTQATQLLMGILDGIACDGKIQQEEANELLEWMKTYSYLKGFFPYDKIFGLLSQMLSDGCLDADEERTLITCISNILHPVETIAGIQFEGRVFCLTGDFIGGSKEEIGSKIVLRGGTTAPSVSKKVDYVVVGGLGSDKWAFGNFGGKVKKALEMIEQGVNIKIIRENALFDD